MSRNDWQSLVFILFLLLSILPIIWLGKLAIHDLTIKEMSLAKMSQGQAIEDVVGFGFWSIFPTVLIIECVLLVVAWFSQKSNNLRFLVYIPASAFIVTSIFSYAGYHRVFDLLTK